MKTLILIIAILAVATLGFAQTYTLPDANMTLLKSEPEAKINGEDVYIHYSDGQTVKLHAYIYGRNQEGIFIYVTETLPNCGFQPPTNR